MEKIIVYPNLISEMAKRGEDSQKKLGDLLKISQVAAGRKLNGKNDWKLSEAILLSKRYKKDIEELFKKN